MSSVTATPFERHLDGRSPEEALVHTLGTAISVAAPEALSFAEVARMAKRVHDWDNTNTLSPEFRSLDSLATRHGVVWTFDDDTFRVDY